MAMRLLAIAAATSKLLAEVDASHQPRLEELADEYMRLLSVRAFISNCLILLLIHGRVSRAYVES